MPERTKDFKEMLTEKDWALHLNSQPRINPNITYWHMLEV